MRSLWPRLRANEWRVAGHRATDPGVRHLPIRPGNRGGWAQTTTTHKIWCGVNRCAPSSIRISSYEPLRIINSYVNLSELFRIFEFCHMAGTVASSLACGFSTWNRALVHGTLAQVETPPSRPHLRGSLAPVAAWLRSRYSRAPPYAHGHVVIATTHVPSRCWCDSIAARSTRRATARTNAAPTRAPALRVSSHGYGMIFGLPSLPSATPELELRLARWVDLPRRARDSHAHAFADGV